MSGDHRFPYDAFPVVVAHRGASSTHPENTLSAFERAIELGAPAVELDVRLTADGIPVVVHDADVSRTTDGRGFVHELTRDELRALKVGPERREHVPSLREALEVLSGRAGVAVEIKNLPGEPAFEADGESIVEAALAELDAVSFDGPVLVISFNPRSVATARSLRPDVPTGFLITDAIAPDDGLAHAITAGHDVLLPGARGLSAAADAAFVRRAHDAGVRIGTWTVDDPGRFLTFLEWGVDVVATNDPAMGLRVLSAYRETASHERSDRG